MLPLVILGTVIACVTSLTVPVTVGNHWEGGFNGEFCIPFAIDVHSWKANLVLSEPIDKLEVPFSICVRIDLNM